MTTRLIMAGGKTRPQARMSVLGMEKIRAMLIAERGDTGLGRQSSLHLVVAH